LAEPRAPGQSWTADVVVQLSPPLLDQLIGAFLTEPLQASLAEGALTLTQRVRSLDVHAARGCASCVGLDLTLSGRARWLQGTPLAGAAPVEVTLAADGVVEARRAGDAWTATLALQRVRDVAVTVEGRRVVPGDLLGGLDLDRSVRAWLREELPRAVPPIPLATFESDELPLLALRAVPDGDGLRIEARSDTLSDAGAALVGPPPAEGFRLGVAAETALALARAQAFRGGEVGYGVVPEPTALQVDGDGFSLGLRLWRPVGRGWWRDYDVTGTLDVVKGKLRLAPDDVVEGERSPGAAAADPLAALFEGKILDAIGDAVQTPIPTRMGADVGESALTLTLTSITGADGTLVATGTSGVSPAKRKR
jgi:hypothetical protein